MLAAFWDDADLTLGDGKLLYQVRIAINNAIFCGYDSTVVFVFIYYTAKKKLLYWQFKLCELLTCLYKCCARNTITF